MSDILHYDHGTWMAKRALDAAALGPPKPPPQVTLPGAKAAIDHDRLLAYQDLGLGEHEIRERVNARYDAENADRLAEHKRWAAGPYQGAIEELRRQEMQRAAEEQRRRAIFEQIVAEREET